MLHALLLLNYNCGLQKWIESLGPLKNPVIAKNFSEVRQAFGALRDILSLCQTFFQLMIGKYQWSFLFSLSDILCLLNWTFYVSWTLLDKMSGKVWALWQILLVAIWWDAWHEITTTADVCQTCPACPGYFAITENQKPPKNWIYVIYTTEFKLLPKSLYNIKGG